MPELPEVEAVRKTLEHALKGKKIKKVEAVEDDIVLGKTPPKVFEDALKGRTVKAAGRKGKVWWLELDGDLWLFGHLGMTGWIRDLGKESIRLREHGRAPWEDENGRPRFLKLLIEAEDGCRVAFTDGRRLGRLWLSENDKEDKKIKALGFDALAELPTAKELEKILAKRSIPIKALLLDQGVFAGVGNWVADEVLYNSRISPKRLANSLDSKEVGKLRKAVNEVLKTAVEAGADSDEYPKDWLFHHRWGGARGSQAIKGKKIVREEVGGRTTAWIPELQK